MQHRQDGDGASSGAPSLSIVQFQRRYSAATYEAWRSWPLTSKPCCDCYRTLDASHYFAKTRWPCGLPRTWPAYCKECVKERTRFYARQRRRRQGIPERTKMTSDTRLARRRARYRAKRLAAGFRVRTQKTKGRGGYGDRVPMGPFQSWFKSHLARAGDDTELATIAERSRVDVERLRKFANGKLTNQTNVTLGFVDRVLIAADTNTALWELYSYEED